MNVTYITVLLNFEIKERLDSPIEMKSGIYISNNPKHVEKYFSPSQLHAIGTIETSFIFSGRPYIYQIGHVMLEEQIPDNTVNFLREVQAFIMGLWLRRDCGVNNELAFGVSQDGRYVHSNSLTIFNERADAKKVIHRIDLDELNKVVSIYKNNLGGAKNSDTPENTRFQKGLDRIGVSFSHLQSARSGDDLAVKIAYYCTFFESILSTTTNELSHQVSERAAHILGHSKEDKIRIYKGLKNVYGIRSRIFHGENVSKKQLKDISDVSVFADTIARQLISEMLGDNNFSKVLRSSDSSELESYMLDLLFRN
ncbi:MAG: hypothetical protein KUG81_08135 [Gammaproteobacteria bacterium]|nr:hypothetical protein [Gammaproteobacteria bacterium]